MSLAFQWVDFAGGRARFVGGSRGWDDAGHETFAVDLDGRIFYGEVHERYAGNVLYLEISSFGYDSATTVGIPGAAAVFTLQQSLVIEKLIRELVAAVSAYSERSDRPSPLRAIEGTSFGGDVIFAPGWIALTDA